jgi:hypothetical protein
METRMKLVDVLDELALQIGELDNNYRELDDYIAEAAQIERIDALKRKLVEEAKRVEDTEIIAESAYARGRVFGNALGALATGLAAKIIKQEHPFQAAYDSYVQGLQEECCFGIVMIALRNESDPEQAEVISISKLARDGNKSEAGVMASFKQKGYLLLSPEQFWKYLDRKIKPR